MQEELAAWLDEIKRDEIVISDDAGHEACENLWAFSFSSKQASSLSVSDLDTFVSSIIQAKQQEASRRGLPPILFYLWFDEQSGQLCFSLTSVTQPRKLAFNCRINPEAELASVLGHLLSSSYLDGIPFVELAEIDEEQAQDQSNDAVPTLDVFVARVATCG